MDALFHNVYLKSFYVMLITHIYHKLTCHWFHYCLSLSSLYYEIVYSSNLTNHIKEVHETLKYLQCDQCEFATAHGKNLRMHITAFHNGIQDLERFSFLFCILSGNLIFVCNRLRSIFFPSFNVLNVILETSISVLVGILTAGLSISKYSVDACETIFFKIE